MLRIIYRLFILACLLGYGSDALPYVPRQQDALTLNKEDAENIKKGNILGISRSMTSKPELERYLYTIIDFNNLSIESIDNLNSILPSGNNVTKTLQNYYRPQRIVSAINQIQALTIGDVATYKNRNPQMSKLVDDVVALSIDSVSSDILFEEYLYLRACKLIEDAKRDKNAYQAGKKEYIASLRKSIDEYLAYESKLFNAVFYLESLKAWTRMNEAFKEIVKTYSDYAAPKSLDKMKTGFEKLVNSYDSKQNLSMIVSRMERFQNQCNLNRRAILESFMLSDDMMPVSTSVKFKATSPYKFNYQASPSGFSDFYSYKSSLDKKSATAGLASNIIGLFTGPLGSVVADAASGAYKSSNISDIAKKDLDTRKVYVQDAYNKGCANLNEQLSKLEKSLRTQYNQNTTKFKNELSNIK